MKALLIAIALIALSGCAAIDRPAMTDLTPLDMTDDTITYTYRVSTDRIYPEDSEKAERTRIEWLEQILEESGHVDPVYTIKERRLITTPRAGYDKRVLFYKVEVQR